ncbi:nucleoside phosphorylase [Kineococcus gynurae]|uniref:Uridine phosphorylase n=1 Tax=Kineococcus gynurae TaxID=452979 RepID=A0ABV5LMS9_9ACTN
MIGRPPLPLLDFDPGLPALIEPGEQISRREVPEACVVTFFGDAVDRMRSAGRAAVVAENRWEDGPHPLLRTELGGGEVSLLRCGVGAPMAAGLLEETIALGCRAFVVCGGAGALTADLPADHLLVVGSAVRDEGTSHHYVRPGRVLDTDEGARAVLEGVLRERGLAFRTGRVWTTDAPYRETPAKIALRREEGCLAVEMEAAALAAVAAFRGVPLAQVVYAGDDLSGPTWDARGWRTRTDLREGLLDVAAAAALRLAADR